MTEEPGSLDPAEPGVPGDAPAPPPPPIPPDAGRAAWYWAGGLVALCIVIALVVFVLAARSNSTSTTTPTAQPATASPTLAPITSGSPTATASPTATPAPPPTAVPTPTPAPTPAPVPNTPAQQAAVLFPDSGNECGGSGNYSHCPVTAQLIADANYWRANHGPSAPAPLCRCPVPYSNPTPTQNDALLPPGYQGQSDKAAVNVRLFFQPGSHTEDMVVLFARQSDGTWLAFGTYCDDRMNSLGAAGAHGCIN